MEKVILIPSAKLIPVELQAEFGPIPSAMVPLHSQTALDYIISQYQNSTEFLVAINESGDVVTSYANKHLSDEKVTVLDVGETHSLGATLLNALDFFDTAPHQLIINFADTVVHDELPKTRDFIFYAKPRDLLRWTTFELDDANKINHIIDKNTIKADPADKLIFIGVFGISDTEAFRKILQKEITNTAYEIDPFYNALQFYYNTRTDVCFLQSSYWYDFGHLDTYYESKMRISERCRQFNSVSVDATRGIITKKSENADKFLGEISWYLKLPSKIQYIAPRVFDYSLEYKQLFIDLEFYGYPSLDDLYLFGNLDMGTWSRIFDSIAQVMHDMRQFKIKPVEDKSLIQSMKMIYENKTINRIEQYIEKPEFERFRQRLAMNDKTLVSLHEVVEMLPDMLIQLNIYDDPEFTIIHGDLCLSNILYDRRNRIVRLIDPRGSFGEFDIYGDVRYDLCKLTHSLLGDYDFLVNGLFDLEFNGKEAKLLPHISEQQSQIKIIFLESDLLKICNDLKKIRFLESLLFLSMVPLHNDRPRSQQAFVLRGLELFSGIAEGLG